MTNRLNVSVRNPALLAVLLMTFVLTACGKDEPLEPVLDIHALGASSYRIGDERFDLPVDGVAWRSRLLALAEGSEQAPKADDSEAPIGPTLRVALHAAADVPFLEVIHVLNDIGRTGLWRVELVGGSGERIPIPFPWEWFPTVLCDPPDQRAEEYWDRTVSLVLRVSETPPRRLECWFGPRLIAGPAECQKRLRYWFSQSPADRIEVDVHKGVRYGEVLDLLKTIREAGVPPVPFVIVGPCD